MSYFGIVSLFNGLAALLVGLYVLLRDRRNPLYLSFWWFAITVALWAIFYSIWQSQDSKPSALFFMRLLMVPAYFIPSTFLWLALTVLELDDREKYLPAILCVPALFVSFSFTNLMVSDVVPRLYFPFWPNPGWLMHLFVVWFFGVVSYGFYLLFRGWFSSVGMRRWQLRWVTITTLFEFLGGSTNWFLWYNIPIPPIPNLFVGVFFLLLGYGVIRRHLFDIDALADIIQEARLSTLGILAASINHEIRNPLFVAKGAAESFLANRREGLLEGLSAEEREKTAARVLEETVSQISRASEIMKRVTELSKPHTEKGSFESFRLEEAVDTVLSFVRHEVETGKIQVEKSIDPDAYISADRHEIEEVLMNLIVNASQAMSQGGLLRVSAEQRNGYVRIYISDTGEGISPDKIKRIFDPFFSTKKENGTGLGLYIVKKLVERSGGKVQVRSQLGMGTSFTIELPMRGEIKST